MNPHSRWKWDTSAERPLWWEWNAQVGLSLEDGVRPSVDAGACGQTRVGSAPVWVWLTPITASLLPNAAPRMASPSPTLGQAWPWGTQAWSLGTRGSEVQAPQLSLPGGEHSGNRSPRVSWLPVQVLGTVLEQPQSSLPGPTQRRPPAWAGEALPLSRSEIETLESKSLVLEEWLLKPDTEGLSLHLNQAGVGGGKVKCWL